TIKGEYIHMSEERIGQGIRGENLPDILSRGWYVLGGWSVLGKLKSSGRPKNPLLTGRGFGSIEVSGRLDVLTFYSAPGPGLPSRSPRAPTILPNSERTWTFGPTWSLNRFVKIQAHAQRERLTDIDLKAEIGRDECCSAARHMLVSCRVSLEVQRNRYHAATGCHRVTRQGKQQQLQTIVQNRLQPLREPQQPSRPEISDSSRGCSGSFVDARTRRDD